MSQHQLLKGKKKQCFQNIRGYYLLFSILSTSQTSKRHIMCINNYTVLNDRKSSKQPRHNFLLSSKSCNMTFSILGQSIKFYPQQAAEEIETLVLGFTKGNAVRKGRSQSDRFSRCLWEVKVNSSIYHENLLVFFIENS